MRVKGRGQKVLLKQLVKGHGVPTVFKVTQLVNRIDPPVGELLRKNDVRDLIAIGVTVTIK